MNEALVPTLALLHEQRSLAEVCCSLDGTDSQLSLFRDNQLELASEARAGAENAAAAEAAVLKLEAERGPKEAVREREAQSAVAAAIEAEEQARAVLEQATTKLRQARAELGHARQAIKSGKARKRRALQHQAEQSSQLRRYERASTSAQLLDMFAVYQRRASRHARSP